jgi:hypothetical protein
MTPPSLSPPESFWRGRSTEPVRVAYRVQENWGACVKKWRERAPNEPGLRRASRTGKRAAWTQVLGSNLPTRASTRGEDSRPGISSQSQTRPPLCSRPAPGGLVASPDPHPPKHPRRLHARTHSTVCLLHRRCLPGRDWGGIVAFEANNRRPLKVCERERTTWRVDSETASRKEITPSLVVLSHVVASKARTCSDMRGVYTIGRTGASAYCNDGASLNP